MELMKTSTAFLQALPFLIVPGVSLTLYLRFFSAVSGREGMIINNDNDDDFIHKHSNITNNGDNGNTNAVLVLLVLVDIMDTDTHTHTYIYVYTIHVTALFIPHPSPPPFSALPHLRRGHTQGPHRAAHQTA